MKNNKPNIEYDLLDYSLLLRRAILQVNPLFQKTQILNVLMAARALSKQNCTYISIYLFLRLQNKGQFKGDVYKNLTILISHGFITKTGSQYRLTQTGNIELQRIAAKLQDSIYRYRKTDSGLKTSIKRPKI